MTENHEYDYTIWADSAFLDAAPLLRMARQGAWDIAHEYGMTLSSIIVQDKQDRCRLWLRRSPEGDGLRWYQATPPSDMPPQEVP